MEALLCFKRTWNADIVQLWRSISGKGTVDRQMWVRVSVLNDRSFLKLCSGYLVDQDMVILFGMLVLQKLVGDGASVQLPAAIASCHCPLRR